MIQNLKCNDCGTDFSIEMPKHCMPCHPSFKATQQLEIDLKKKMNEFEERHLPHNKWRERKRFAYHLLLYVPICIIISRQFGVWYEMAWILGGVHISMLPFVRDWFMRIF